MTKHIVSILLLFAVVLHTSAQKEVYFTSTPKDSAKVESMNGFEIESGINTSNLFTYNDPNNKSYSIPFYMGYFNEKRISPSWTLITRIGLNHSFINGAHYIFYKDSVQMPDSMYYYNNSKIDHYKFEYQLTLGISIEPRWYFDFKYRHEQGKALLNSGWFLSLPVSARTTLINTYKPDVEFDQNLSFKTYCLFYVTGVVGYRQAISKQLFLEAQGTFISLRTGLFSGNNQLYITNPHPDFLTGISLKAAYTFK